MLLKDVDKKLDMQCRMTIKKDDRIFTLSKAMNTVFPAFLEVKDDEKMLMVYVPKSDKMSDSLVGLRVSSEVAEESIAVKIPLEDSIFDLLTALDKIPSSSSATISVDRGELAVQFRLHHDFLASLSDILSKNEVLHHVIRNINILPSEGFIYSLVRANSILPLSVLEYALPLSIWKNQNVISVLKKGGIGELAGRISGFKDHKMLIYGVINTNVDLKPIVTDSSIYETALDSDILQTLNNIFNVKGIQRYNVFFKVVNDSFRIIVFLKTQDTMNHISNTFNLYLRTDVPVNLMLSRNFTDEIWSAI